MFQDINSGKELHPSMADVDCPICLQKAIHPTKLPCGHIFCYLCLKGVVIISHRCALCRRETSRETIERPQLLYGVNSVKKTHTLEDGFQWFYEGRNGWWEYDERTSMEIETAFKENQKCCTILVAGFIYIVDFETMMQRRQNDPSKKRCVKRDRPESVHKKGVAGIRLEEHNRSLTNSRNFNTPVNSPTSPATSPPPPAPTVTTPYTATTPTLLFNQYPTQVNQVNINLSGNNGATVSSNNIPTSSGINRSSSSNNVIDVDSSDNEDIIVTNNGNVSLSQTINNFRTLSVRPLTIEISDSDDEVL